MTPIERELALQEMQDRILLGYALNSGRIGAMSPAEGMAAAAVGRDETQLWADAVRRLIERGLLEALRLEGSGWSIPVFRPYAATLLPLSAAAAIRLKMPPAVLQRARILRVPR